MEDFKIQELTPCLKGRWLVVSFEEPQAVVSWALIRGGVNRARKVAWYQVNRDELEPPVDPEAFLKSRLEAEGLHDAVGLLTSTPLHRYTQSEREAEGVKVHVVATVGTRNALRVGDPVRLASSRERVPVGTINLLCAVSKSLSLNARMEVLSIATEGRTLALAESGIRSVETGKPATGTGTDCIVVASPEGDRGLPYAGKHTLLGHLVGSAVLEAVRCGLAC